MFLATIKRFVARHNLALHNLQVLTKKSLSAKAIVPLNSFEKVGNGGIESDNNHHNDDTPVVALPAVDVIMIIAFRFRFGSLKLL